MSGIKYFPQDLSLENKTIILRVDLNVPIREKKIQDFTRISLILPFLEELIKKKSKIIIISHLGRPKGLRDATLSLLPVYKHLKEKLSTNMYFYTGEINDELNSKCSYLKNSEVLLIENIRFFREETDNEENFSKKIGKLGDIYINDAFSCSHRKQASIHGITKFVKAAYAGPLLKKEIIAINSVVKNKKEPLTCIIGGSKISTKITVISNLIKSASNIIIVGAMANNFLKYNNCEIGKSLKEDNSSEIIKKIMHEAEKNKCKIIIPEDCAVSKSFEGNATPKDLKSIEKDDVILDVGPKTLKTIEKIIDSSNTVMWNGPAGYFENKNFAVGTNFIAQKISENTNKKSLISVIGGGDTVSAINKSGLNLSFTHLSTAGGAFLEYLEGKDLPGLSVLK
ncbi:MAG: phosphoglycerate kinase [Pelagibacteraceae bacterium]|jgi:phosphoglycerate kinase|nr:phosphoglycerate kinase [Pelagibacteraceae bacterium]